MPYRLSAVLFSLLPALAVAQSTSPALPSPKPEIQHPPASESGRPVVYKPSIEPLEAVFAASNRPWAFANVRIDYDAAGNAVDVDLFAPSGDEALDLAIRAWAAETRISPVSQPLQDAVLPFVFFSEDVLCESEEAQGPSCLRDYGPRDFDAPLLRPLDISLLALWGADEQVLEAYFEHDANGRLSHLSITRSAGGIGYGLGRRMDALRLRNVSAAGYGRLRLRLIGVADAREAATKAGDDVVLVRMTRPGDARLLVRKSLLESRLSVFQQMMPPKVLGDVAVARIFHDAGGTIVRIQPLATPGQDLRTLQSVLDALLMEAQLVKTPGRAGSLQVMIYPDGSVLPPE